MDLPFQIAEILERLDHAGYSAFVVGGCVRDHLMGLSPHDFDITTAASPRETERVFADCRVIETGIKHGTVTVLYKGASVEITTFRVDGEYSDGRHPDSVSFSRNIEDDLSRRDFTMNGIAYSPKRGFVDPFGGERDIRAGIIRAIGDPDKRFSEDALRVVRALRFSATLGFPIEENTARAMDAHKNDLRKVSAERIFAELKRLICGKDVKRVLLEFPAVFSVIIPPLAEMVGYDQGSKYHNSTLYEHTARAVEAAPPTVEMRLAMLFHDLGKPHCKSTDENGECHYYGHAAVSAEMAGELLRALKCDNALRERVVHIVHYHDIPVDTSRRYFRRQLAKHGAELFSDIMEAHIADDSAKAPFCLERIPKIQEAMQIAEEISREAPPFSIKSLAISGKDLKGIVPPSPLMGEILARLLEEVVDETLPNEKNALLSRAVELSKELKDLSNNLE
ncbi:MAG: HD domain-containing protein [Oscillospiraceae bacterium]|nr:HD domain-containing protein [Oscillospiraceae bacterium]